MKLKSQFVVAKPRPNAESRLFCFPHAGAGPVVFFDWAERLGPKIECVCVQYPGRGQRLREEPYIRVEDSVREISEHFFAWLDKPFAFYGHSFGGLVAFELARQLKRLGMPGPHHLFVGASRSPHLDSPHPPLHRLAEQEFVESVQARYGGIPATIYQDPDVLKMFLPAMRADFTAYETYKLQPDCPLNVPITAFAGADDTAVSPEWMREWALHTDAGFDMNVLPGSHFFLTTNGGELVRALRSRIAADCNERKIARIAG